MTVLLRSASAPLPDTVTPSTPVLAQLRRIMLARPFYQQDDALTVCPDTFIMAEQEMKALMTVRGFARIERQDRKEPNFLLFGIPVVKDDERHP